MKQRSAPTKTATKKAAKSGEIEVPASDAVGHSALAQRRAGPQSFEEAESRYVAARDAWTAAMRAANSGRPADLAALAIAQEAYEAAAAERERWLNGARVAIPIDDGRDPRVGIEAAVEQELRWRTVRHPHEPEGGLLKRIGRRLFGR